jgi:single-strand DNA-binding protein
MPFPSPTNSATLIGKLTRDPELRTVSTSAGDRSVLTLGIAVRKPIKTDQDDTPTADFVDVTVWGPLAETCAAHLAKGKGTVVQYAGRLYRPHRGKHEALVYDYVDAELPVLTLIP